MERKRVKMNPITLPHLHLQSDQQFSDLLEAPTLIKQIMPRISPDI